MRNHGTVNERIIQKSNRNGLFPLPDSDSDSDLHMDSYTMQDFSIGSDLDSDPLIEMYLLAMEICP